MLKKSKPILTAWSICIVLLDLREVRNITSISLRSSPPSWRLQAKDVYDEIKKLLVNELCLR